ncbi:MAG: hypothetical protein MZW92_09470 [Comamonadaceae bacterium]|nr:hypothetical protein [Comamonadaceae bacterium]
MQPYLTFYFGIALQGVFPSPHLDQQLAAADDHRCDKNIEQFAARFRGPADEGWQLVS